MGCTAAEAVPTLIAALQDEDEEVRWSSAEALAWITHERVEAIPVLITGLDSKEANRRRDVAVALSNFGSLAAEAVPGLVKLLTDEEEFVRGAAQNALNLIGISHFPQS
jgi:HEAT repeat protein